jgi:hypothetical protein
MTRLKVAFRNFFESVSKPANTKLLCYILRYHKGANKNAEKRKSLNINAATSSSHCCLQTNLHCVISQKYGFFLWHAIFLWLTTNRDSFKGFCWGVRAEIHTVNFVLDKRGDQLKAPASLTQRNSSLQFCTAAWIEQCFELHAYRSVTYCLWVWCLSNTHQFVLERLLQ